ncbi:hypothetical protein BYT27DRAFT_7253830 [Phlegmacium glaucopus]|nr:hypothetical protein BYT27DRAFT_7253830 [Phlegmacium glaucopus]
MFVAYKYTPLEVSRSRKMTGPTSVNECQQALPSTSSLKSQHLVQPKTKYPPSDIAATIQPEQNETENRRILFRWWIVSCLGFLILSPAISVLLGLKLHARDFQYLDNKSTFDGRTVLLEVVLISVNPLTSTMILDWTFIGESQSDCSPSNLTACSDINIFFDNNLLRSADPSLLRTSDRPSQPIFRFNASAFVLKDIVANTPTFRTELALFSPGNHQSSLIYYPFDIYSAEIFTFAQDTSTNATMGLRLANTRGIAAGFKTNTITRPNVNIPAGMVDIVITISRGNLIMAYSIVATIAIWMITLILLLVMITTVLFGFRQKGEVLVIPVATLFAFTQLRQTMPGAPPGFGDIIDFVGLLPCLALLSLSAAFTLGAFILTDPTDHPLRLSWDLWFDIACRFLQIKHFQDFGRLREKLKTKYTSSATWIGRLKDKETCRHARGLRQNFKLA